MEESREGVRFSSMDAELFGGAGVLKGALVDYLDAMSERILPELRGRPLSVIRVSGGSAPFMQKNVPKYAPEWIATLPLWADASQRTVSYALCDDRRTLLWFANQRAVEYHPTLVRTPQLDHPTHLVLDIDPPEGADFSHAVRAARMVQTALAEVGLVGAVKTSGAKGLHIVVPVADGVTGEDAAAATRAIARRAELVDPDVATTAFLKSDRHGKVFLDATRTGGATVIACYSPRARPGVPVSFPVGWDALDEATPSDFTIANVPGLLADTDPWRDALPPAQELPADLLAEGHEIPIPRVAAMHEGKRRKARGRSTGD